MQSADLLSDTGSVLALAVDALSAVCPHGLALAFTRRSAGAIGAAAASHDGRLLQREMMQPPSTPIPWIVDLDHVPDWQQNRWIEPIGAGIHGKDYFIRANPVPMALLGARTAPDYGRIMVCRNGQMRAWLGLYVDEKRGFRAHERAALAAVAAQLANPLRAAAVLNDGSGTFGLTRRQSEIMTRVAKGMTNKQIARDLDISPSTVKTLLERMFRVSQARNRAALVLWWHDSCALPSRLNLEHRSG
jgi:DNA-binding CsgD family transcriptional regulator